MIIRQLHYSHLFSGKNTNTQTVMTPKAKAAELIKYVREMRYLQKRYFVTKDKSLLIESKKLEAIVDNLIADKLF